jgi:hypothetical protein
MSRQFHIQVPKKSATILFVAHAALFVECMVVFGGNGTNEATVR